jgi:hypothetical protein
MENISILPIFISTLFKKVPVIFRNNHKTTFMWLTFLIALGVGNHKLKSMGQYGSHYVAEYRFRRILTAGYWSLHFILIWLANEVIHKLPKPENHTIYLVADGSKKEKRGKKNIFNQKGKIRSNHGWFFGVKFVVLMIQWGNFRIPVDFEVLYKKGHEKYLNENQAFRKMIARFQVPKGIQHVIVLADAGFASKENLKFLGTLREQKCKHTSVLWSYVVAFAKTWKLENGQELKNIAQHTKRSCYKQFRIPSINGNKQRSYWAFAKQASLRHIGDVTIVFSKVRRNTGPKHVKVIVTNLPNVTAKQVLCIYQRRFLIEVLFKELKSGLGLGKQQVSKNENRITNSIGMSLLAYLLILKCQHTDIVPGESWSIFKLQEKFRYKVLLGQTKHDYKLMAKKLEIAA